LENLSRLGIELSIPACGTGGVLVVILGDFAIFPSGPFLSSLQQFFHLLVPLNRRQSTYIPNSLCRFQQFFRIRHIQLLCSGERYQSVTHYGKSHKLS
jgi:hypothetical protein